MSLNRRRFLNTAGVSLTAAPWVQPTTVSKGISPSEKVVEKSLEKVTKGLIDCQSHLFFPEVLDVMRRRKSEPLVFDQDGMTILKMGDWVRKIPATYTSINDKLSASNLNRLSLRPKAP
jgi:hypothetical protein